MKPTDGNICTLSSMFSGQLAYLLGVPFNHMATLSSSPILHITSSFSGATVVDIICLRPCPGLLVEDLWKQTQFSTLVCYLLLGVIDHFQKKAMSVLFCSPNQIYFTQHSPIFVFPNQIHFTQHSPINQNQLSGTITCEGRIYWF